MGIVSSFISHLYLVKYLFMLVGSKVHNQIGFHRFYLPSHPFGTNVSDSMHSTYPPSGQAKKAISIEV